MESPTHPNSCFDRMMYIAYKVSREQSTEEAAKRGFKENGWGDDLIEWCEDTFQKEKH